MSVLEDWTSAVCEALGVEAPDQALVLDLARDVAHGVARPAAPLTAYLVGVAVGRGADPKAAAATISDLATTWPADSSARDER